MSWQLLQEHEPELAAFGAQRLHGKVAYLATIRADGAPRLHPVIPIIGAGRLFVFMEPTSPKGHDLRRDGRYALHCSVSDTSGEIVLAGRARLVADAETRALAVQSASYAPAERYILFELDLDSVLATTYPGDQPVRLSWKRRETGETGASA